MLPVHHFHQIAELHKVAVCNYKILLSRIFIIKLSLIRSHRSFSFQSGDLGNCYLIFFIALTLLFLHNTCGSPMRHRSLRQTARTHDDFYVLGGRSIVSEDFAVFNRTRRVFHAHDVPRRQSLRLETALSRHPRPGRHLCMSHHEIRRRSRRSTRNGDPHPVKNLLLPFLGAGVPEPPSFHHIRRLHEIPSVPWPSRS